MSSTANLSATAANYAGAIESMLTYGSLAEANEHFNWSFQQLHRLRPAAAAELAAWWLTHPANASA